MDSEYYNCGTCRHGKLYAQGCEQCETEADKRQVKKGCTTCGATFGCDRSEVYRCGPENKLWVPKRRDGE